MLNKVKSMPTVNELMPLKLMDEKKRLLIVAVVFLLVSASWLEFFDKQSLAYIDKALVQATVTFGLARAFNAVISVLQSVEISVVAVSITIGEALDPLNDLVEQFSTLMQYAVGSLIIQKLLVEIVSHDFFKIVISATGAIFIASMYINNGKHLLPFAKTFIFTIFLRYIFILVIVMNAVVDTVFLNESIDADIATLSNYPLEIKEIGVDKSIENELKSALEQDLNQLQSNFLSAQTALNLLAVEINAKKLELTKAKQKTTDYEKNIGLINRIGINKDDKQKELLAKEVVINNELSLLEDNFKKDYRTLSNIKKDILSTEAVLSGENPSFMDSLGSGFSSITNSIGNFKEKLNDYTKQLNSAIPDILNTMALFFFRVFILPLTFLFIFIKGFKMIWGIDFKEAIKKGSRL